MLATTLIENIEQTCTGKSQVTNGERKSQDMMTPLPNETGCSISTQTTTRVGVQHTPKDEYLTPLQQTTCKRRACEKNHQC